MRERLFSNACRTFGTAILIFGLPFGSIHASETRDAQEEGVDRSQEGSFDRELTLRSELFGNTRKLRITLPPSYFVDTERRYPTLYFTDGVGAWHGLRLPEIARRLWSEGSPEAILIGMDNGGSTAESKNPQVDRAAEYLPYPDPSWVEEPKPTPRGDLFPSFLLEEVQPFVRSHFRIDPAPRATCLAGSSYGAVIALYTAIQRPGAIGCLLLESPSLHIGDGRLLDEAAGLERWPDRLYIGAGTEEGDTDEARITMLSNARRLRAVAARELGPGQLLFSIREGGTHSYEAWQSALPQALRFALDDLAP